MKKSIFYLIILIAAGCAVNNNPETDAYPAGLIFPLKISDSRIFPGMNIGPVRQQDGRLYWTTRKGRLICVNAGSGEEIWSHQAGVPWNSPPYLGEDGIFAVSSDNKIVKFDYEGERLWEIEPDESVTGGIAADSGFIYFGDESGRMHARSAETGARVWEFSTGGAVRSAPCVSLDHIFFGSSDGNVYILNRDGKEISRFKTGGEVRNALYVEGNRIFFGSCDQHIYCGDWKRKKILWKMKTGGEVTAPISMGKKNFYSTSGNLVLYCFNKKNGTMKWWKKIPSHTLFSPLLTGEKVVVSSSSPELVSFEKSTGNPAGHFNAPEELKSNPVWSPPRLLVSIFHDDRSQGELLFLEKAVYVTVEASPDSPQTMNQNIEISAQAVGFFQPQYEFMIQRFMSLSFGMWPLLYVPAEKSARVMQSFSEESTWAWFPEKRGGYIITVKAKDEKESAQTRIYYLVLPEEIKTEKGGSS